MDQFEQLDNLLKKLDSLLEELLNTQFGIEDKEWIDAISTIENGYAMAKSFISKRIGV